MEELVTVATYSRLDEMVANVVCSRLEAMGIDASLTGVKDALCLQVPAAQAERASEVLRWFNEEIGTSREGSPAEDPSPGEEPPTDAFVTVGTYLDITLAHLVRGCLEAEGIDAWVADESAAFGNEGGILAAQGIRVNVPADQAEEAVRILQHIEAMKEKDWE
jgi:hypothetical protein